MPIEDINPATPADTDDIADGALDIRNLKQDILDSLPDLGPSAVTVSATDINDVTNKLTGFNGRTDLDVVPTEGDYSTDLLGDVDTSTDTPIVGDVLRFDGSNFVPNYTGISSAQVTAQSYNGAGPFQIEIDGSDFATAGLTVDTANNRITNVTGRTITVVARFAAYLNQISVDSFLSINRNGTIIGEEYAIDRGGTDGDIAVSFERVFTLADTQYVEVDLRRNSSENMNITAGGTLTVQGV